MISREWIHSDLAAALEKAWCKATAYPPCRDVYDEKHPSWGNCFVSSLVIRAVQGGKLLAGKVDTPSEKGLWHFRNYLQIGLKGEFEADSTWEQFDAGSRFRLVTPADKEEFREMMMVSVWEDGTLLPRLSLLITRLKEEAGYDPGVSAEEIVEELRETYSFVKDPSHPRFQQKHFGF